MPIIAYGGGNTTGEIDVAACLTAHGQRLDFEKDTFALAFPERMSGTQVAATENVSPAIMSRNPTAIAFSYKDHGADAAIDLAPTLRAGNHDTSHANGGQPPAIAFAENNRSEVRLQNGDGLIAGPLSTGGGKTRARLSRCGSEYVCPPSDSS